MSPKLEEIKKKIISMSGKYNVSKIFSDWVTMIALEISSATGKGEDRKKQYKEISERYCEQERSKFAEMLYNLVEVYEEGFCDALGEIYMSLNISNKNAGQFFTPYAVCKLMARLCEPELDENGYYTLYDGAVGAGALIIAHCEYMLEREINYQQCAKVVAQDIDYLACCMSYVQFSFLGVPALVVHGNTLTDPYTGGLGDNVFATPMYMMQISKVA